MEIPPVKPNNKSKPLSNVMHNKIHPILARIKSQGLLPLFFHANPDVCQSVVKALYAAGIRTIEFTNRGEQALQNFSNLVRLRDQEMKDLVLGIGTIKTAEQARQFMAEGADFLDISRHGSGGG